MKSFMTLLLLALAGCDEPAGTKPQAEGAGPHGYVVSCDSSHVGSTRMRPVFYTTGLGTVATPTLQRCVALQDTFCKTETKPPCAYDYAWVMVSVPETP